MARSDDDTWDVATSVGTTAVGVAVARARATAQPDPLIRDQFAAVLIGTPELQPVVAKMASLAQQVPAIGEMRAQMVDYHTARTHYFDQFFTAAAQSGIRQHVILASGLDSRAFRLDWPAGATVYEIDQPKVIEYKADTLAAHGATPAADWRLVPVDLRHDWPAALTDQGFDPTVRTAWSVEGLLPFLTGPDQDRLLEQVDRLSAPGSRVALEAYRADGSLTAFIQRQAAVVREQAARLDVTELTEQDAPWYGDDGRTEAVDWLGAHGWKSNTIAANDYLAALGRSRYADESSFAALARFTMADNSQTS